MKIEGDTISTKAIIRIGHLKNAKDIICMRVTVKQNIHIQLGQARFGYYWGLCGILLF